MLRKLSSGVQDKPEVCRIGRPVATGLVQRAGPSKQSLGYLYLMAVESLGQCRQRVLIDGTPRLLIVLAKDLAGCSD